MRVLQTLAALLLAGSLGQAEERIFVYLTGLTSHSARLAWGSTHGRGNTIGREARPLGRVEVEIAGRLLVEQEKAWIMVEELEPDRVYPYQVRMGERVLARSSLRTFPLRARQMAFLAVGDYGKGTEVQRRLGKVMLETVQRLDNEGNPVRFILTTGDNIYGNFLYIRNTGDRDEHWRKRFFAPYRDLLLRVPFYPSLGNHDGDESEDEDDLEVYVDNFFTPPPGSLEGSNGRYYGFNFAGLAHFFILDSTENPWPGQGFIFREDGPQHAWLRSVLRASRTPWNIVVFHNPIFNAGPRYEGGSQRFAYLQELLAQQGVQLVLNGHEHNFQVSDEKRIGGIRHIITGGGAATRDKNIVKDLEEYHMALWSSDPHFLLVEIGQQGMHVTALGTDGGPIQARTADNAALPARVLIPVSASSGG